MSPPLTDVVERHVRRLDDTALTAFVADLWAARGFDVAQDYPVVHASDDAGTTTLLVHEPSRFGGPPSPDHAVDVVVTAAGPDRTARLADRLNARRVAAPDLAEMIAYAVDRETAARLCDRHLGAPPDRLSPSRATRVRSAVVERAPSARSVASVAVVALALVAVVATGGPGVPGLGDSDPGAAGFETPVDDGPSDDDPDDAVAVPRERGANGDLAGVSDVPGLNRSGVVNATALARAHREYLADRSYEHHSRYEGPIPTANGTPVDGTARTLVVVEGEQYEREHRIVRGDEHRRESVYYDGTHWFVREIVDGNESYERVGPDADRTFLSPRASTAYTIRAYFEGNGTNVTGAVETDDGERLYRLVSRTPPENWIDASNYTVVAFVDEHGLVRDLWGNYTRHVEDRTAEVTFAWSYDNVGGVNLGPPIWYREAFGDDGRLTTTATPTPVRGTAETTDAVGNLTATVAWTDDDV